MFRFSISALHTPDLGSTDRLPGWTLPITGRVAGAVTDTEGDGWLYAALDVPIAYRVPMGVGAGKGPPIVSIADVALRPHYLDENPSPGMRSFPMDFAVVLDPSMGESDVLDLNWVDFIAVVEVDADDASGAPAESGVPVQITENGSESAAARVESDIAVDTSEVEVVESSTPAETTTAGAATAEFFDENEVAVEDAVDNVAVEARAESTAGGIEGDAASIWNAPVEPMGDLPAFTPSPVFDPGLGAPTVEAPTVEAPTVEAPTVEAPTVRPPGTNQISAPSVHAAAPFDPRMTIGASVAEPLKVDTAENKSPKPRGGRARPGFVAQVQMSTAAKTSTVTIPTPSASPRETPRFSWNTGTLRSAVAAVAAVAIGAAGVYLWTRDSGSNHFATKESSTGQAPSPPRQEDVARVRKLLPPGYRPEACLSTADTEGGGLASLTCDRNADPGGPVAGLYTLFPNVEALDRAFNRAIGESERLICPGDIQSPGPWRRNATPDKPAGMLFCGMRGQDPVVIWSDTERLTLNVTRSASRGGPTLDALFDWWSNHS